MRKYAVLLLMFIVVGLPAEEGKKQKKAQREPAVPVLCHNNHLPPLVHYCLRKNQGPGFSGVDSEQALC